MNGRIYDPTLGRFLQADPHVQAPSNSQNYNRYSYVLNNPMSMTDPSGYFFNRLFKEVNRVLGDFAPLASIGLAIWAPWGTGFWATVGTGAVAGGIATGSLKGALVGGFSAGMFHGIGTHFQGMADSARVLSTGAKIGKTLAHGFAGGLSSVLSGGKFGHGFASAGFTQGFSGAIDKIGGRIGNITSGSYFDTVNRVKRVIAAAVVGGTASVITGGKFGNGAVTGAFSRAFNDEAHFKHREKSFWEKLKRNASTFGEAFEGKFGPSLGLHVKMNAGGLLKFQAGGKASSLFYANFSPDFGWEGETVLGGELQIYKLKLGLMTDKTVNRYSEVYGTQTIKTEPAYFGTPKITDGLYDLEFGKFSVSSTVFVVGFEASVDFKKISSALTNWD